MVGKQDFKIIGINSDNSQVIHDSKNATIAYNIRITPTENSYAMEITNEKGTRNITLGKYKSDKEFFSVRGVNFDTYFVIFSFYVQNKTLFLYIEKYEMSSGSEKRTVLFDGEYVYNSAQHNFEKFIAGIILDLIPVYENERIQKVFWSSLNNDLMCIVIDKDNPDLYKNKDSLSLQLKKPSHIDVKIFHAKKQGSTMSMLSPGTVQYFITSYEDYGTETGLLYISDIYYISDIGRGTAPDSKASCVFNITIDVESSNQISISNLRLYGVYYTSEKAEPTVKVLRDFKVSNDTHTTIRYTDDGSIGRIISSGDLLVKLLPPINGKALCTKNNTLFIGDISVNNVVIDKSIKSLFKNYSLSNFSELDQVRGHVDDKLQIGYENYTSLDGSANEARHFKCGETYRFGICLQKDNGDMSEVIFLNDYTIQNKISYIDKAYLASTVVINIDSLKRTLISNGKYRSFYDYCKKFNYTHIVPVVAYPKKYRRRSMCQGILNPTVFNVVDRKNNSPYAQPSWFIRPMYNDEDYRYRRFPNNVITNRHLETLRDNEIQIFYDYPKENKPSTYIVDQNILSLYSPDIEFSDFMQNQDLDNFNLEIVGLSSIKGLYNKQVVNIEKYEVGKDERVPDELPTFINQSFSHYIGKSSFTIDNKDYFYITPWCREGSFISKKNGGPRPIIGNSRYGLYMRGGRTYYLRNEMNYFLSNVSLSKLSKATTLLGGNLSRTYYSNIDTVVKGKTPLKKGDISIYDAVGLSKLNEDEFDNIITRVRYTTAPHAVITLDSHNILPKITIEKKVGDGSTANVTINSAFSTKYTPVIEDIDGVDSSYTGDYEQRSYNISIHDSTPLDNDDCVFIAELVNKNYPVKSSSSFENAQYYFEGYSNEESPSDESLYNNDWFIAGNKVPLSHSFLEYYVGDTYFQRYDALISRLDSKDQKTMVTNLISFLCESSINIEGRYDSYYKKIDVSSIDPEKFNKINPVYNDATNFITLHSSPDNNLNVTRFSNTVVWSKQRIAGSKVDSWSDINQINSLDVDGTYGSIKALVNYNDIIYIFQNRAISRLFYNEQTQIPTKDENIILDFSNKVSGYKLVSTNHGLSNHREIAVGGNGIYFYDDVNKSLNLLNSSGITDLGKKFGINNIITGKVTGIVYNSSLKEVYIKLSYDEVIAFSELTNTFTSLYDISFFHLYTDYTGVYLYKDRDIYKQHDGPYNIYMDKYYPSYIEFIANELPDTDKTFTNVHIDSDMFGSSGLVNNCFTKMEVWNPYQSGEIALSYRNKALQSMRRKFRTWRLNIPRDTKTNKRIRNNWTKIRLSYGNFNEKGSDVSSLNDEFINTYTNKLVVQNLSVIYYY